MKCKHLSETPDWEGRLALYAGGDLSGTEAAELERRISECPSCAAVVESFRENIRTLRSEHREFPAPPIFAAVRARVLAEVERGRGRVWRWAWLCAAAAAVVVAFAWGPRTVRAPGTAVTQGPASRGTGRAASVEPVKPPAHGANAAVTAPPARGARIAVRLRNPVETAFVGQGLAREAPEVAPEGRDYVSTPFAEHRPPPNGSEPDVATPAKEPLVIKLFTDDPDVVIYWIAEGDSQ